MILVIDKCLLFARSHVTSNMFCVKFCSNIKLGLLCRDYMEQQYRPSGSVGIQVLGPYPTVEDGAVVVLFSCHLYVVKYVTNHEPHLSCMIALE